MFTIVFQWYSLSRQVAESPRPRPFKPNRPRSFANSLCRLKKKTLLDTVRRALSLCALLTIYCKRFRILNFISKLKRGNSNFETYNEACPIIDLSNSTTPGADLIWPGSPFKGLVPQNMLLVMGHVSIQRVRRSNIRHLAKWSKFLAWKPPCTHNNSFRLPAFVCWSSEKDI